MMKIKFFFTESMRSVQDAIEEMKITYNHTKVWKKNYVPIFDPAVPIGKLWHRLPFPLNGL